MYASSVRRQLEKITLTISLIPLPDDKILDWSKLKQIADGISASKCGIVW